MLYSAPIDARTTYPSRTVSNWLATLIACSLALVAGPSLAQQATEEKLSAEQVQQLEGRYFTEPRQLTFDGKRAGEGYYSRDGQKMVFQSEREGANPFYQIYLLDFETGDVERVSPGQGKTTCAWIHPDGTKVMYASTQGDPDAVKKQKDELAARESGTERRYAWDYDDTYELYEYDLKTKQYRQLTETKGYDAEGCYSPDGKLVVFASNRRGFTESLDPKTAEVFQRDPSVMSDIFIMNADGSGLKQLTSEPGYDGGPFFSHDGQKICYRHFDESGAVAEIFTMNLDGSDKKQLTRLGAMSWAPFFHPSGEYLIFATNRHGFSNFELYVVDAAGKSEPVRISATDGFDGLASFSPDGNTLTWTSNRTSNKSSQIFVAKWNHEAARKALGIDATTATAIDPEAQELAQTNAAETTADFRELDLMKHVDYLCHPALEGRMTGTPGERKATAYVAAYFDYLGLQPAGDNGSWFQSFDFSAGAQLGPNNSLTENGNSYELNKQWRPLTFSKTGKIEPAAVVFAGYGIVAPKDGEQEEYDSYVHLDVKDKWVLMFRYLPEKASDAQRQHLQYHSNLRKKAMDARDKGARGIIIVSGPTSMAREQLVPLEKDFSMSGSSVAAISVTDEVAAAWFQQAGEDMGKLQEALDSGKPKMGFELANVKLSAEIEMTQVNATGRNVIGRLVVGESPSEQAILVGAHIDHLGNGRSGNSLARDDESTYIHFGADDNASGVAAMLEIAEYLAKQKKEGKLKGKRDIIFAGWSGEELGLLGSQHYVEQLQAALKPAEAQPGTAPVAPVAAAHAGLAAPSSIAPRIAACLNMDMVGRYNGSLVLQGISSSPYWNKAAEKNATVGLTLKLSNDTNLPTDASSFYRAGVPILAAFTGSHTDYHTPRDTADKLNYADMSRIARLMGLVARGLVTDEQVPNYTEAKTETVERPRAAMRAYLGSIPEYGGDVKGVLLGGVTADSPLDKAGVKKGDVIVELAGRKVENVYDYTYAIEALKIGQETTITVLRGEEKVELKVTPGRR
jgi:Tol biopolymer transport system component/Zn-dependent M28 family amino/carboxypeptidase